MKSCSSLLIALALAACSRGASGPDETRVYPLENFDSVSAEAGVVLILKQGPFSVEAQSRNADLSNLKVEVRGSELNISNETGLSFGRSPTFTVTASAPKWTAIKVAAGVKVNGENLQLEDITVDGSAGVTIELSGSCRTITADISAGAVINARDLKCAAADVEATAGAKAEVFAAEKVRGEAAAGAVINVFGNPPMVEKKAEIGGVVNLKED